MLTPTYFRRKSLTGQDTTPRGQGRSSPKLGKMQDSANSTETAMTPPGLQHSGGKRKASPPPELFVDNKAAIDVAYNPEHHTRMKHVDRRHFFVRELIENHRLRVPFVSTVDNLADFFTKAQPPALFESMRDAIMNVPHDRVNGGTSSLTSDFGYGGVLSHG